MGLFCGTLQVVLLLVVLVSGRRRPGNCGNHWCKCNLKEKMANCYKHGHNLTYIPSLPEYITKLDFSMNFLPHVSRGTFDNISSLHLVQLNITYNSIQEITPNAFSALTSLRSLSLKGNKISSYVLTGIFPNLSNLSLSTISLENLHLRKTWSFRQFCSHSLQVLILDKNDLNVYNHSDFEHMENLQSLSLGHNYITSVSLFHSFSLQKLNLRDNAIKTVPNFCNGSGTYFPNLKELKLDHNALFTINGMYLKCLRNLMVFSANSNRILYLSRNTFSELTSLADLSLRELSSITRIEGYAFNNSNIKYISLTSGGIAFKKVVDPDAFRGCSSIASLDVSSCLLSGANETDLEAWFGHLTSLIGIGLGNCHINQYPNFIPLQLKHLKFLKFYDNYIDEIPFGAFQPLTNLTNLWMSSNHIAKLDEVAFPPVVRNRLQVISLMSNPFACNCELLWFLKWTKSEPYKFQVYPKKYICVTPGYMKGKTLSQVDLTEYTCVLPLSVSLIIIGCLGLFLFILFTVTLTYRWRWHIRYYLYQRKKKRGEFRQIAPMDIVYDAYVIYSLGDIKWIKNELIPNLEGESGKKLYIRDRDSLAGIPIVNNVVNNMAVSRRVLVVVSDAMARDEQCQFELMFVQRQEEGLSGPIILVLLEEVQTVNVTQSVYALVKMHSYISWSEEQEARELFWDKLKHSLHNVENGNQQAVQNQ